MIAPQGGARDEFKVTTPAEAGIAFLDGPRIGGYGAEPDLAEPEETARPEPPAPARESPRPAFAKWARWCGPFRAQEPRG